MISASCAASLVGCRVMTAIGAPSDQARRIAPTPMALLAADGQRQQHIAVAEVQRLQLRGAQVIIIRCSLPLGHRRRLPTGNQPRQRVLTFRRIVADRLNGRPAEAPAPMMTQAPSGLSSRWRYQSSRAISGRQAPTASDICLSS